MDLSADAQHTAFSHRIQTNYVYLVQTSRMCHIPDGCSFAFHIQEIYRRFTGDLIVLFSANVSRFLVPIAFQQTNRPVPVVYSLNTEFQLCNNEKVFMMDPSTADMSMAEMDYKGAFSMGKHAADLCMES